MYIHSSLDDKKEPDFSAPRGATKPAAPFSNSGTLQASESSSYSGTSGKAAIPIVKKN